MAVDVEFLNNNNVNNINTNFQRVKTALVETLGREGDSPNQMNVDLDMNSNDILNVGTIQAQDITVGGDNITGLLERAEQAVVEAETAADTAEGFAVDAELFASQAAQSAIDAETAADVFPLGGTTGQVLTKDSNDDYDTSWTTLDLTIPNNSITEPKQASTLTLNRVAVVNSRTELAALDTSRYVVAYLKEGGRSGEFIWDSSNRSLSVTSDVQQGIFVPPASASTGASGAWVRVHTGVYDPLWFGVISSTGSSVTTEWNRMMACARHERPLVIQLRRGTYTFTAKPVTIDFTIDIIGAGKGATVLARNYNEATTGLGLIAITEGGGNSKIARLGIVGAPGTTGGSALSLMATSIGAPDFCVLDDLYLSNSGNNTFNYTLYVDGTARTTAPVGVRDLCIRDCSVFGATSGAAAFFGVVALTWIGGAAFAAGGSSGRIVVSGSPAVNSFQPYIALAQAAGLAISTTNDMYWSGTVIGDITNASTCTNFYGVAPRVSGTVQAFWTASTLAKN